MNGCLECRKILGTEQALQAVIDDRRGFMFLAFIAENMRIAHEIEPEDLNPFNQETNQVYYQSYRDLAQKHGFGTVNCLLDKIFYPCFSY